MTGSVLDPPLLGAMIDSPTTAEEPDYVQHGPRDVKQGIIKQYKVPEGTSFPLEFSPDNKKLRPSEAKHRNNCVVIERKMRLALPAAAQIARCANVFSVVKAHFSHFQVYGQSISLTQIRNMQKFEGQAARTRASEAKDPRSSMSAWDLINVLDAEQTNALAAIVRDATQDIIAQNCTDEQVLSWFVHAQNTLYTYLYKYVSGTYLEKIYNSAETYALPAVIFLVYVQQSVPQFGFGTCNLEVEKAEIGRAHV